MKSIIAGVGILVLIVVVAFGGAVLWDVTSAGTSVLTAPGRVINRTLQTGNIISNYEWFTDQYNSIEQAKSQLKSDKDQLDALTASLPTDRNQWTYTDRESLTEDQRIVTGARNIYTGLVNDYNSKAEMLDRNIFKDRSLPDHIAIDTTLF